MLRFCPHNLHKLRVVVFSLVPFFKMEGRTRLVPNSTRGRSVLFDEFMDRCRLIFPEEVGINYNSTMSVAADEQILISTCAPIVAGTSLSDFDASSCSHNDEEICAANSEDEIDDVMVVEEDNKPALTEMEEVSLMISSFVTSAGLTRSHVHSLLKLLHGVSNSSVRLIPKSAITLERRTSMAMAKQHMLSYTCWDNGDDILSSVFDVSSVNVLQNCVTFYYRDPLQALLKLLTRHFNRGHVLNWKFRELSHPDENGRCYWGDTSGNWWRDFETHELIPGCKPLVFKLFSDGTSTLANCAACPIVMSLANLEPAAQAKDCGKVLIGYVPYLNGVGASAKRLALVRKSLYQFCMEKLGCLLWPNGQSSMQFQLGDEAVQLQVVCKNLVYDGPEARKAAQVGSACIECLCARKELGAGVLKERRTAEDMMRRKWEADEILRCPRPLVSPQPSPPGRKTVASFAGLLLFGRPPPLPLVCIPRSFPLQAPTMSLLPAGHLLPPRGKRPPGPLYSLPVCLQSHLEAGTGRTTVTALPRQSRKF